MKIISTEEYNNLIKKVETLEKELADDAGNKKLLEQIETLEKTISNISKDTEILFKRKELECDNAVILSSQQKIAEIAKLTLENGNLTQKVEMYEKAFENLGFDVKDMKDILNKLVDGIVSKNTVHVVK